MLVSPGAAPMPSGGRGSTSMQTRGTTPHTWAAIAACGSVGHIKPRDQEGAERRRSPPSARLFGDRTTVTVVLAEGRELSDTVSRAAPRTLSPETNRIAPASRSRGSRGRQDMSSGPGQGHGCGGSYTHCPTSRSACGGGRAGLLAGGPPSGKFGRLRRLQQSVSVARDVPHLRAGGGGSPGARP